MVKLTKFKGILLIYIKFGLINHLTVSSRCLFFLFLTFGLTVSKPLLIHAQDLNYTHYTVESGLLLPSNEVYGILFDKNKVLWATTDRGVWRYDGYSPRQFTVADGLKENANFRIFSDTLGRIWVSSINNYLYQIAGDSVQMHPMSESIHKMGSSSGFIQQITENTDSSIYLSFNRPGLIRFKYGELPYKINSHRINHENASVGIHYKPDEYYWDMIKIPDTNQHLKTTVTAQKDWIYLTCGLLDPKNNYRKDLSPIGENEFLFSYSNKVFHIKDGKLKGEHAFSNDIIALYTDKKGNFWIGLEKEGVLRYLKRDLKSVPQRYLQGESVSGIAEDHEGNYWFATTTNGVFQANTLDISVFQNVTTNVKDNIITAMTSDGENVYLGTQTGLLLKGTELLNQNYFFHPINIPDVDGPIRKLFFTPEKHLIVYNNHLMEIDTLGQFRGIRKIEAYPYDYIRQQNGEWLASFTSEIDVIKNNRIIRRWDKETIKKQYPTDSSLVPGLNRVRTLFLDSGGRLWTGSQKSGLFTYQDSIIFHWEKKDSLFGKRIHDIVQAGENIWVSIADYGLAVIRPDSSFFRITQKDGLSSDIIDVMFAENDSVVWAGTNNGLNRITLKHGSKKPDSIAYYTMREGLPSNRIFQIIKHKNNIWISTTHGAIRLNPEFTKPLDIPPKLVPGPLLVNGKSRELTDSIVLGRYDKNLVFKYKAITYRKPSTLRYRYRLIGIDNEYIITNNLESQYPDLTYGNYTFCINASYNDTFDPATEKKFSIQIQRNWYETHLARVLSGLLLLGLIFIVFRLILKETKKRELEKRQLLHAEKRSLLSQMNPHFIFNSLNSIQHFIIQNDQFQANNYLTNFSGLIRRILENSKKNLIPLNEEISTLTLYLSMEKLRFENEFEYQIIKDNRIDYCETMIPPMLLQPFVENAIWHGLMPLKTKGSLIISFTFNDDFFQCRIEDNGIGREKASKIKGKKEPHVSTGIQNVQERIELLNKMNKKKIHLTITDLRRANGTPSGTLVEIVLPIDIKL
ncbi:MAG: hypothetical protein D4R64_10355 [Porphyromonadaceae bacterium]|nr:MAG: hypothetical protein D4R64_10355 [Porphyromonadaceae bacterium]